MVNDVMETVRAFLRRYAHQQLVMAQVTARHAKEEIPTGIKDPRRNLAEAEQLVAEVETADLADACDAVTAHVSRLTGSFRGSWPYELAECLADGLAEQAPRADPLDAIHALARRARPAQWEVACDTAIGHTVTHRARACDRALATEDLSDALAHLADPGLDPYDWPEHQRILVGASLGGLSAPAWGHGFINERGETWEGHLPLDRIPDGWVDTFHARAVAEWEQRYVHEGHVVIQRTCAGPRIDGSETTLPHIWTLSLHEYVRVPYCGTPFEVWRSAPSGWSWWLLPATEHHRA